MKAFKKFAFAALIAASVFTGVQAEHLVIAAVNDTHSLIEPDNKNLGGALRRRAIYDQIRSENKNAMVVHVGDAVQGTMYFSLYRGKVEYALLDTMRYDLVTFGNHEFDNGIEELAANYNRVKATKISSNYDFSATNLKGVMPYVIRTFGGKKIGFFAVNVNPVGMVAEGHYDGLRYLNAADVADPTAKYLKEVQKVDYVVMLSHIGYMAEIEGEPCDSSIVAASHYIDFVIGGHSHTLVEPGSARNLVKNADGKVVTVGQNGKWGQYVGVYDLDLETGKVAYKHIKVDGNYDEAGNKYTAMKSWLAPYKHGVDSLMNNPIGTSLRYMDSGSDAIQNWLCDAVMDIIPTLYNGKVDFCIMNKGGIRVDMPKGTVTEGVIRSMFPFDNRFMVLQLKGSDILEGFRVMANRYGDAVSKQIKVVYNDKKQVVSAKLNGKEIKADKLYTVATIDFLANGGDFMTALGNGTTLFTDNVKYGDHVLDYIKNLTKQGKVIDAKDTPRFVKK